jgi:hypothetical protein
VTEPQVVRRRPGTSGWAVFSFVLAVAVFCPPATLLAPVVGLYALLHIREVPGRGGRGMARSAIAIGVVGTAFWIGAVAWVHRNVRQPLLDGPALALRAAQNGDLVTFRAAFDSPTLAGVSDEEAARFVSEITRRYGRLQEMTPIEPPGGRVGSQPAIENGLVDAWYRLTFEHAELDGQAPFLVFDDVWWRFRGGFTTLRIVDTGRGDLTFPAGGLP